MSLLNNLLSFKPDVNVPSICNKQRSEECFLFVSYLESPEKKSRIPDLRVRIKNVSDLQDWFLLKSKMLWGILKPICSDMP